jgi:protein PhnA
MGNICDLCGADGDLTTVAIAPRENSMNLCPTCTAGLSGPIHDGPHWHILHEAIWSTYPVLQVLVWHFLTCLKSVLWARELPESAYLEPDIMAWAQQTVEAAPVLVHRDSNSAILTQGETVVLIKDLLVKGASFTAKRGTAVRSISLVVDNEGEFEGRVNA